MWRLERRTPFPQFARVARSAPRPDYRRPRTSPELDAVRRTPRSTTSSPSSRNARSRAVGERAAARRRSASARSASPRCPAPAPEIVPARHQVARAERCAVRRRVRELLRHRPVERRARSCANDRRRSARPRGRRRAPSRARRRDTAAAAAPAPAPRRVRLEQRERRHPGRDRRRERLAEERPERLVLPALDVARAPVVDEHDAEDVVGEASTRHRLAEPARHADDEAELELDVEPAAGAERRRRPRRGSDWPRGRTTSVPLRTTVPARP